MKLKTQKMSTLLLASLLAATQLLTACQNSEKPDDTLPPNDSSSIDTDEVLTSGVPDDVRFNGETIRILNAPSQSPELFNSLEANGEILNDAVYRRNSAVMDKLGIKFEFIEVGANDVITTITNTVQAQDDEYDLITGVQYNLIKVLANGFFHDIMDAPYIDISNPWWSETYINNVNLGRDRRYFVTGDITLQFLRWTSSCYFNKQMYEDFYGDPSDMYQLVYDGKWTFDKLEEMTKNVYQDVNNDGKTDMDDILGYSLNTFVGADSMYYNAGAVLSEFSSDGMPMLKVNTERNIDIMQKLYDIFFENPANCIHLANWDLINGTISSKFASGQMLFMFGWFYSSDYLRDMKDDYGVIPYPKYNEATEDYRAIIHNDVTLFCLPVTCQKFDAVAATLEEMAYQGYMQVSPTYYEAVLKNKYVRGDVDEAAQMIDFIHDRIYTETVYVYASQLSNAGYIQRDMMGAKSKDMASTYAQNKDKYEASLAALLDNYSKLEN
ncbi:MAG: hypothetical protein HFE63_07390 [Clostridiales bacterium]|nr:hypothetical protein [Clostridiales bacterium]